MYRIKYLFCLLLLSLSSCQKNPELDSSAKDSNDDRELLHATIAAHGGLEKWYSNGLFQFRWKYNMLDKGLTVNTLQTVDPSTLNVIHQVADSDIQFGIHEGQSWIHPAEATFKPHPKFWALTPTYFIGIPFIFNDPNAHFQTLEDTMSFEGKEYTQLKITYNDKAGDSPDDYYVLLIDPETKLTRGAYYTVTNPLVLDGKPPGPPKFITLDGLEDFHDLQLATSHRTFYMEESGIGEIMRNTEISEMKFLPKKSIDFSIPEAAKKL